MSAGCHADRNCSGKRHKVSYARLLALWESGQGSGLNHKGPKKPRDMDGSSLSTRQGSAQPGVGGGGGEGGGQGQGATHQGEGGGGGRGRNFPVRLGHGSCGATQLSCYAVISHAASMAGTPGLSRKRSSLLSCCCGCLRLGARLGAPGRVS